MRVRTGAVAVAVAVIAVFAGVASLDDQGGPDNGAVFHATLADPEMYVDGTYARDLALESGMYGFRFTPNGDSPQTLSIRIAGGSVSFEEDFVLKGTLHSTGISEYYTWEYLGADRIHVAEPASVRIVIDPNGNLLGAVSVSLLGPDVDDDERGVIP